MSLIQVHADSVEELRDEFSFFTNMEVASFYHEGSNLCFVVDHRDELTEREMYELRLLEVVYDRSVYNFSKVRFQPMREGERIICSDCSMIAYFNCTVPASMIN